MRKEEILVGTAYVNEEAGVIREVVEELDEHCVSFNSFDMHTGMLMPTRHRICHKGQIARWAQRVASDPEVARIHPYGPGAEAARSDSTRAGGPRPEEARAALDGLPSAHMFQPNR